MKQTENKKMTSEVMDRMQYFKSLGNNFELWIDPKTSILYRVETEQVRWLATSEPISNGTTYLETERTDCNYMTYDRQGALSRIKELIDITNKFMAGPNFTPVDFGSMSECDLLEYGHNHFNIVVADCISDFE